MNTTTRKRNDNHGTEFGEWLRNQPELDSKRKGFSATNIDYYWTHYRSNKYMLIEEKRHGHFPTWSQLQAFKQIDKGLRGTKDYYGFHVLVFEETNPTDGAIWWNNQHISTQELIEILQFNLRPTNDIQNIKARR